MVALLFVEFVGSKIGGWCQYEPRQQMTEHFYRLVIAILFILDDSVCQCRSCPQIQSFCKVQKAREKIIWNDIQSPVILNVSSNAPWSFITESGRLARLYSGRLWLAACSSLFSLPQSQSSTPWHQLASLISVVKDRWLGRLIAWWGSCSFVFIEQRVQKRKRAEGMKDSRWLRLRVNCDVWRICLRLYAGATITRSISTYLVLLGTGFERIQKRSTSSCHPR